MKWVTFHPGVYLAESKATLSSPSMLWLTVTRSSSGKSLHASLAQGDKDRPFSSHQTVKVWGPVQITRKNNDRTSLIAAAKRWAEDQIKSPLERLANCRKVRRVNIEPASGIIQWSPDIRAHYAGFSTGKPYDAYWTRMGDRVYCLKVRHMTSYERGRRRQELSLSATIGNDSNLLRVYDAQVFPYLISEKAILDAGTEMLELMLRGEE